jgi:hypothetical protein
MKKVLATLGTDRRGQSISAALLFSPTSAPVFASQAVTQTIGPRFVSRQALNASGTVTPACPERSRPVAQSLLPVRLFLVCHPDRRTALFAGRSGGTAAISIPTRLTGRTTNRAIHPSSLFLHDLCGSSANSVVNPFSPLRSSPLSSFFKCSAGFYASLQSVSPSVSSSLGSGQRLLVRTTEAVQEKGAGYLDHPPFGSIYDRPRRIYTLLIFDLGINLYTTKS